jgi:hypothetical protein
MGGDQSGRSGGRPTVEDSETNKDRRVKTKDMVNARPPVKPCSATPPK